MTITSPLMDKLFFSKLTMSIIKSKILAAHYQHLGLIPFFTEFSYIESSHFDHPFFHPVFLSFSHVTVDKLFLKWHPNRVVCSPSKQEQYPI